MEGIKEKAYWVWLSMVPGIGARRFYTLMDCFGTPRNLWESPKGELSKVASVIGQSTVTSILKHRNDDALEKAGQLCENREISILTLEDMEYPETLKTIYDPPPVLYCKGQTPRQGLPSIAIVGSRNSTEYGRQAAEKIAYQLACAGVTVVSGLARGIDTMSHIGALNGQGYTIGVLGCGVDVVYPPENRKLFTRMQQSGTILSEFPPGTQPIPRNFPARNRIISGLSQGVLVIEAGTRSGALITVDFALEQGRDVFAMPGNIDSIFSQGTNQLLKEGAKLVTRVEDILEELHLENPQPFPGRQPQAVQLDFFETQVYNALEDGEKQLEELVKTTGIEVGRVSAILTILEIKGIIKQLPGKIFIKQWKG